MRFTFEEEAKILYANDDENKRNKAIASGILLDNSLKLEYTKAGHTNCHFRVEQWLKYFDYSAVGEKRWALLLDARKNKTNKA